jgi:preprotein translocase subunit Sss1
MLRNEILLAKYVETYIVADLTNGMTLNEIRSKLQSIAKIMINKRNLGRILAKNFKNTYDSCKRIYFINFTNPTIDEYSLLTKIAGLEFIIKNNKEYIKSLEELNKLNNDLLREYGIIDKNGYLNPNAMKLVRLS